MDTIAKHFVYRAQALRNIFYFYFTGVAIPAGNFCGKPSLGRDNYITINNNKISHCSKKFFITGVQLQKWQFFTGRKTVTAI
jgi:hypothetical protein